LIRIELGQEDLLASRFALSPLGELGNLLHHLGNSAGHPNRLPPPVRARWSGRFAEMRAEPGIRAMLALQSRAYSADFVAPPPAGMAQTIADDLAVVRATPAALAREEIGRALHQGRQPDRDVQAFLTGQDVVGRLADALETAWTQLIGPDWPQLRAIIERDVVHRAGQLTRAGWAAALTGMHDDVAWRNGGLEIRRPEAGHAVLGGRGLLFVPSVFVYPGLAVYLDPPWRPALVYPARGSAALWEQQPAAMPGSLQRLLGASRARLLLTLDEPASTTQLAATAGLSLGAVGGHLRILLDAGLLSRARAGRSVLYRRTPTGDALIAAQPQPEPQPG